MAYRSNWNEQSELKCLLIFKQLEADNFPRGKQSKLCKAITKSTNLDATHISAKVCNYKSVAGINNSSNYSKNTFNLYHKYKDLSISELKKIIENH